MTFKSVLAAADFRREPDPAVVNGVRLARMTGAHLHVLHCITGASESSVDPKVVQELLPPGSELSVQPGEPHEVIAARALTIGADVIVLGSRAERSPISGWLGTTAEKVIRASRVPCLLSNAPLTETPRRILLAMDRSVPARQALRVCMALTRELASQGVEVSVHLLNVSAFAQSGMRWDGGWVDLKKYAKKMQAAVATAAVTHGVFSAPLPAEGILTWVGASEPDLLIMGTHGSGIIGRLLMGSVAMGVARKAAVPLLLVPPRARGGARNVP
jgi:nucleotide-binding universal stress UspA family protein